MITKPKVKRFRIRRPLSAVAPETSGAADGFGTSAYPTALPSNIASAAEVASETEIDAIRREGLTGRQLRLARRVAQKHDLPATSDFDAIRLLRRAGIDPFQRTSMLELVSSDGEVPPASRALATVKGDGVRLPQTIKPAPLPTTEVRAEQNHAADILRIQRDILRRRRRKMAMMTARLLFFVLLPTVIAGWYYFRIATPLYATQSEMVIQQADGAVTAGGVGGLGGMLGGALEANKDSVAVQGYLQSREAMARLDADHGFRAHFSAESIDRVQRLAPDASNEDAYKLFQRNIKISYDPTEGLIKMQVLAASPEKSVAFSTALIGYAEEQIDHLTQRKREDQMRDARISFDEAEANMLAAQRTVVELQERFKVMSSEAEVALVTNQIGTLETQLTQDRLSLEQMLSNATPNLARMEPVQRRIATLEGEIAKLRTRMTESGTDGMSLAQVQSELLVAQANVQTRQLMLASTLQQLENARIEANRQVRYLSLSVSPTAPDEPAFPRSFENTLVTFLVFAGIYLMLSMTAAILREQVTS